MAKHIIDGKGKVSKGIRTSCKPNASKHPAIIVQAERVANAMHNAFLNIKIAASHKGDAVVKNILNSAKQNAGNNKPGRGWTANVSSKTLKQLIADGVFA